MTAQLMSDSFQTNSTVIQSVTASSSLGQQLHLSHSCFILMLKAQQSRYDRTVDLHTHKSIRFGA